MSPDQIKVIRNMDSKHFLSYAYTESKPIINYINAGMVAVKTAEKLFAKINRPIAYHVDKLTCRIDLKELDLYGIITLYRTKYGKIMHYNDLVADSCFNRASVIIGRNESLKVYFQSFRKIKNEWKFGLQDAKRSLTIHENHQIFTAKEMQLVLDALTRINYIKTNKNIFDSKYPTVAHITL